MSLYYYEDELEKYGGFFAPRFDSKRLVRSLAELAARRMSHDVIDFWTTKIRPEHRDIARALVCANAHDVDDISTYIEQFASFMAVDDYMEFKEVSKRATAAELIIAISAGNYEVASYLLDQGVMDYTPDRVRWLYGVLPKKYRRIINTYSRGAGQIDVSRHVSFLPPEFVRGLPRSITCR